ncbi:MAG: TIGR04282 family arsenosugar biosynthesis glycosyltransferase [Desulfobacterales bacterium]|nr:MAG: TIGR04282 family arsenosugar biosynthesis glycosyltransferase [Desulfobacterales bacterium]UCD90489.1 MAG: TIGR04282 family arsenosugar biosynthesis glycosyltransferase [Desulfobacterales bacterium]
MDKPLAKLLVVVAKEPVPGKVKTRLFPELSPTVAADLYRCFLHDRIQEVSTINGVDRAIAYTPEDARETFMTFAAEGFELFAQRGKHLGEKLNNIFLEKLSQGYEAVSIVDSDSPDLPKSVINESFHLLLSKQAQVVFGPCHDGGYYLVGMRRPHPELFRNIPWSTENVLPVTLEKARKMGLNVKLLSPWNDLDTFNDLLEFYNKYKDRPLSKGWVASKTFSFLSRLDKVNK